MGYIKIIEALAPIISILIAISYTEIRSIRLKNTLAAQKPINIDTRLFKISENVPSKKRLFQKPWLVFSILLLCMIYVLPEVMISGELTRMAIYKIVMGTGIFFFVLIQTSISNLFDAIYRMKSADLELTKKLLNQKFQSDDGPENLN